MSKLEKLRKLVDRDIRILTLPRPQKVSDYIPVDLPDDEYYEMIARAVFDIEFEYAPEAPLSDEQIDKIIQRVVMEKIN